ncbi:MAG: type II CAAX prenyl endopeptidase Rce1 family protein [Alphaproteobacteria bacterium]
MAIILSGLPFCRFYVPITPMALSGFFHSRVLLWAELLTLTVVIPFALYLHSPRGAIFAALWLILLYCVLVFRRLAPGTGFRAVWDGAALREWDLWRPILIRFVISALLLIALTFWLVPERFLSFPRERTVLWGMVMLFYPILSVLPQEFIFRSYFFLRYRTILPSPRAMFFASALTFGFAHILLHNWVALLLSTVGGFIFAHTYRKRSSLALVSAEHALYGCFLFTIGLGYFFYSGAPHTW